MLTTGSQFLPHADALALAVAANTTFMAKAAIAAAKKLKS
jgi:hypothetical protein